jgi:uncharacterized protein YhaN
MKIRRLDLLAFGPFTGLSIDLSAGSQGLHLIYGPNEAGKSSALRAIRDLFYGIGARTIDNFVHDYNLMRIGAEIEDREGNLLEFRRRKGNKNTLRAADDETPLGPEALDRFLGGIDPETFESLFGIDHGRLVEGGKAILEGRGQVGHLLFAAGSGLNGLRSATSAIQEEIDGLFKPRGQLPQINRLLAELNDLRKDVQKGQLSGDEWMRHSEALREATERKERLDRLRLDRGRERSRLARIRDALKPIAERDDLLARLDAARDVVPLPADFADRHRSARDSLAVAVALAERAEADLLDFEQQLREAPLPDALLDKAEAIETLYQRLGAYRKGQEDRPGRLAQLTSDEHEARDLLVQLGKPRDLSAAESLRLRGDEPERIRDLGRRKSSLDADLAGHRRDLDSLGYRLRELAEASDGIGPEPDVEHLRRAVERCRKLGDLEAALARGLAERDDEHRALALELGRLPHWSGTLDNLSRIAVPLEETIAQAADTFAALEQRIGRADHDLATVGENLDGVEVEIRALTLEREVPTEADLDAARLRRDEGWRLVRLDWLDRTAPPGEVAAFLGECAPGLTLADAFERSLRRADEQADRLRREADRVASLSDRVALRERLARRRDELRRLREADADRLRHARQAWADRLGAQGLPVLNPDELRAWLRRRAELVEAGERLVRLDREVESRSRAVSDQREVIGAALRDAGRPEGAASESLADRLDRAADFVKEVDGRRARREEVRKSIDRTRRERDEAEQRLRQAERLLDEWRAAWSPLMARIGLEPEATPDQADSFLDRIARLFDHIKQARGFRARIEGIDRDARQFAEDVASLAREVAPDLDDRPVESAVAELYRRLGEARDLRNVRDTLAANRDATGLKLREARETIARDRARLDALCREARCNSPDDLAAAEAAAADRTRIESDLRRVEDQIRDCCAGSSLEAFIAEARDSDFDGLDLRLRELDEELGAFEEERSGLDQTIGDEGGWLRNQKGGDEAAEAAERSQSLLAELRARVEDYAALRIATELLHRGIEQFREENQGPVVRRAGELFAALTAGSFEGLRLDEDERGNPVLYGVRNGRPVGVEAMSDGSCDQLYLALRLACLEGWLDRHEPIPLIADDILLNFDDERSRAALLALGELSRRTQVLFFTHHGHLVELARIHLPADVLFVHHLDRPDSTVAVA